MSGSIQPARGPRDWRRTSAVTTPESVALEMRLAGPGTRFLALLFDLLIVLFLLVMVSYVVALSLLSNFPNLGRAIVGLIFTTITFAIFFGYWFILEAWWGGQTIGKRSAGIRVVMRGGYPLTASASLVRNLVRLVDMLPPPLYFVGLVSMVASRDYQRLGDIAAGTLVVRDRSHREPASGFFFAGLVPEQVVHWDTSAIRPADLELIRRFLARRTTLRGGARQAIGFRLARRYEPMVRGAEPGLPPEVFLEGVILERQIRALRMGRPA